MDPLVKILHELTCGVSLPRSRELGRALSAEGCQVHSGSDSRADGDAASGDTGYTIVVPRSVTLGHGRTLQPGQRLAVFESLNGLWYLWL